MNLAERLPLDLTSFIESGFAIVPNVFTSSEIEPLRSELSATSLSRSRAGIRHVLRHSAVESLANDVRLLEITRDVLGPHAFPFHATLFDKSSDANWLVVWHQDTALPLREKRETPGWGPWSVKDTVTYAHAPGHALEQVLAIRVYLDDSSFDNGPLRVLPGTHNRGVLTDDQIHQLSTKIDPVACTVEEGGLVLMSPLVVHASSKSSSHRSRRVLHIEYAAQPSFDRLELCA
jgi:ectoine hydroxylase-related dioxygenase (phytanoyl-CoA dioxygenase family)